MMTLVISELGRWRLLILVHWTAGRANLVSSRPVRALVSKRGKRCLHKLHPRLTSHATHISINMHTCTNMHIHVQIQKCRKPVCAAVEWEDTF